VTNPSKWPKSLPPLTPEQQQVIDAFMKEWLEVLPKRYPAFERFNHTYAVHHAPKGFVRTLEVGAGIGAHLAYEQLSPNQRENYYALEYRASLCHEIAQRFPEIRVVQGDCQKRLDFEDGFFERILAIHVLEHLPDLPRAIQELHRLCDKTRGVLTVVIPCEGGWAYSLGRLLSAKRLWTKHHTEPYDVFIKREHLSVPGEILEELAPYFRIEHRTFFPLRIPAVFCNLVIGLTCRPLVKARGE